VPAAVVNVHPDEVDPARGSNDNGLSLLAVELTETADYIPIPTDSLSQRVGILSIDPGEPPPHLRVRVTEQL